jgi:hypothetical protein
MINDVISLMLNNYEKGIVCIMQPWYHDHGYCNDQPAVKMQRRQLINKKMAR